MNATQLRELIVRPALQDVGLWSEAAEDIVMGTAAQESRLQYVKQLGGGPALSLFQIEPATYQDYWNSYLSNNPGLADRIRKSISTTEGVPPASRMVWDLRFAAIMCRVHYRRISAPLPDHQDIWAYAAYWKRYYNTVHGKGTEDEFVRNYRLVN